MKKLVAILAVGVLAISLVTAYLWTELRTARAQFALQRDRATAPQSAQPDLPRPPAVSAPPRSANQGTAELPQPARDSPGKRLSAQHPDLGKELDLKPAEVEKFFDMLARQRAARSQNVAGASGLAKLLDPDPAAVQEAMNKVRESRMASEAELTAMLGSKYPQWLEYQKTLPARQQVVQLQGMLDTNTLSDTQYARLIASISAEQVRIREDNRSQPTPRNVAEMLDEQRRTKPADDRRLVDAASAHLNARQLETYRKMLESQVALATLMPAPR